MINESISVRGAREHNLDGIDVDIPKRSMTVVTGVSGSGKSSLVFDTIFASCQSEYLESLNSYARQSLPRISPVAVDELHGLSPAIVIDQRRLGRNPRSTVGTVTDTFTFLRLLFSRLGTPILDASHFSFNTPSGACSTCAGLGVEFRPDLSRLLDLDCSLAEGAILHRTWKVGSRYHNIVSSTGHFDMDMPVGQFDQQTLNRLLYSEPEVMANSEPGYVQRFSFEGVIRRLIKRQADARGQEGASYDSQYFVQGPCGSCGGSRLNEQARAVRFNGRSIVDLMTMDISELTIYLGGLDGDLAQAIVPHITRLLNNMVSAGVGYLTLCRSVASLSSGESQRLRLARQMGSALTDVLYVLDEPTVGLHARDVESLIAMLRALRNKHNTVLIVEHDRQVIEAADYVIDMGPGPGTRGGKIVVAGTVSEVAKFDSATGRYLAGTDFIAARNVRRRGTGSIAVREATLHNLRAIDLDIPKNVLVCLTGVSGSGKSSLLQVLTTMQQDIVVVDQAPIGASPRSNPATYVKAFTPIRNAFAQTSGQPASLFTFNSKGACPQCRGLGRETIDMHFLGDISRVCDECNGSRYHPDVLRYTVRGRSITDVLNMTIAETLDHFAEDTRIVRPCRMLVDVGLGYLQTGQSLDTLSGGERQRIKLASKLATSGAIYALDEPTSGLHFADVERLLLILNRLVDEGNTVVVVEHNLDVIKNADWVIDLGPGGGRFGGEVVAEGPPELIAASTKSVTGKYLALSLEEGT